MFNGLHNWNRGNIARANVQAVLLKQILMLLSQKRSLLQAIAKVLAAERLFKWKAV